MEESTLPPIPLTRKTNKQVKHYKLKLNDDLFIDDEQPEQPEQPADTTTTNIIDEQPEQPEQQKSKVC